MLVDLELLPIPEFRFNIYNPDFRILTKPFILHKINIPAGFQSDLATIPWFLKSIYDENGLWTPACIVHDWMYKHLKELNITRAEADKDFLILMLAYGVSVKTSFVFYSGVRSFGWRHV